MFGIIGTSGLLYTCHKLADKAYVNGTTNNKHSWERYNYIRIQLQVIVFENGVALMEQETKALT